MSDPTRRLALRRTRDNIARNRGVLCFSADWRDPVIWAHYSDKHRGLCLGFEIPDETSQRVTYVPRRLKLPVRPALADANALLFTKFISWDYEQEIRVWAELRQRENGRYFKDFDDSLKLFKVIAGARCSLPEDSILAAIGESLQGVDIIRARAGFKKFEVVKDRRGFAK